MSEFGVRIKNIEAASVYEYQNGFREKLDQTDAMLVNSLFLDFLLENGLNLYNEDFTRDVICMQFNYKTKNYEEMNNLINSQLEKYDDKKLHKVLNERKVKIEENKDKCISLSKNDLRIKYYVEGVDITYKVFSKKDQQEILEKRETIKYRMLYRTPGKAKKGTCMFIREELYEKAHNFLYMGIELVGENVPIVEIGAYSSLVTSSIIGKVQIKPEQMLVVKDLPTNMKTKAILVKTNQNQECYVERVDEYDLGGEAFDGQALIDYSLFPEWADGFILLRHHMTKCAAFNTNIVQFLKDQFGSEYETAYVKDMWGRDVKVSEIRFITTNNAIKWLKFGVSFDYWCQWIAKNDYMFGIVKTTHESKYGDVQRMSYQMVNALSIDTMDKVVQKSVDYIENLKSNDESYFLKYLEENKNFSNDFDVLIALVNHCPEFVRSSYYRTRKMMIIDAYTMDFKSGKIRQNADNLTIVGSPYAMLLHSIGLNAKKDPTFSFENDSIQCWCSKFEDGEYLAEFRSPFNSRNNLGYIHNVYHEYFDKYFNLGKLCLAVNTIDTDWQARNNGADQDSDSCFTTNQKEIVSHAKYCYMNYPTIVNDIKPEKNIYNYSLENYAIIDNNLTACQSAIGQSSNLAQLALTYTYNFNDRKYDNYVCILAVLAQVAIDNAKRRFAVDLSKEILRIKKDLDITTNGLPKFWKITKKDKRKARTDKIRKERIKENREKIKKNINKNLQCPMNYLSELEFKYSRNNKSTLEMDKFFIMHKMTEHRRKSKKIEELIEKYSFNFHDFVMNHDGVNWQENKDELFVLRDDFDKLISDIQAISISKNYAGMMSWLINRAFCIGSGAKSKKNTMNSNVNKNKSLLMKVLYSVNPSIFLSCFKEKVDND